MARDKKPLSTLDERPLDSRVDYLETQIRALLGTPRIPYLFVRGKGSPVPSTNSEVAYIYINEDDGFLYVKYDDGTTTRLDDSGLIAGNTLDEAYDQGGVGAGRTINVDDGAVKLIHLSTDTNALLELFRASANESERVFQAGVDGDTHPKLAIHADGDLGLGLGGAATPTAFIRYSAPGILQLGLRGSGGGGIVVDTFQEGLSNLRNRFLDGIQVDGAPIRLARNTTTISNGDLDAVSGYMEVTSTGTMDTLDVSGYAAGTGDFIFVGVSAGVTLTIEDSAPAGGNIQCANNATITLDSPEKLVIFFRILDGNDYVAMPMFPDDSHAPAAHVLATTGPHTGSLPLSDIGDMAKLGSPTFTTIQHMQDIFHSTGWVAGGVMSDAGGATIDVTSGQGFIRATDSATAEILFFDWPAVTGLAITADTIRYVGVEYNAGTPQVVVRTTENWDFTTDFPLGKVVNEGGTLHLQKHEQAVGDHASKMIQRLHNVSHIVRDNSIGGIILGETGTRNITLSAGTLWAGLNTFAVSAVDTSGADRIDFFYRDGAGGWTKVATQSQWPNTKYDDNSGTLATLGNNKYAVLWFYIETDGDLTLLYGQGEHNTLAAAENESVPSSTPNRLTAHGLLIGRMVFQKSGGTADSIDTVFVTTFTSTGVVNHSDLGTIGTGDHHTENHATRHTDGSDDIQDATVGQRGIVELADSVETIAGTSAAFALVPLYAAVVAQYNLYRYAADAEASDTYKIALTPTLPGYVVGAHYFFKANTANTGAATLEIEALGAKAIKKHNDQDLADGDIEAGQIVEVAYDGTNFQMVSQLGNAPSGGGGDPDQNLFETVTGDTGSAVADAVTDTLKIEGGTGITTVASSSPDKVVITGHAKYTDNEAVSAVEVADPLALAGIVDIAKHLDFAHIASPGAPSSGETRVYGKTDGKIYRHPFGGAETELGGGGAQSVALLDGSEHTDTVAAAVAEGSLVIGNATPKWDALVKGADHTVLTGNGTTAVWSAIPPLAGIADIGDTTRITLSTIAPHFKITGATELGVTGGLSGVGIDCPPSASSGLVLRISPTHTLAGTGWTGLSMAPTLTCDANSRGVQGVSGTLSFYGQGFTGLSVYGLNFGVGAFTTTGTTVFTVAQGIRALVTIAEFAGSLTVTKALGLGVEWTIVGTPAIATAIGAELNNPNNANVVDYTGLLIDNETAASGNIYLLEIGPPYLRVVGNFTAAANATPIYISEGATPTLRQLKTKAGDTLGAGDLVCVLV